VTRLLAQGGRCSQGREMQPGGMYSACRERGEVHSMVECGQPVAYAFVLMPIWGSACTIWSGSAASDKHLVLTRPRYKACAPAAKTVPGVQQLPAAISVMIEAPSHLQACMQACASMHTHTHYILGCARVHASMCCAGGRS